MDVTSRKENVSTHNSFFRELLFLTIHYYSFRIEVQLGVHLINRFLFNYLKSNFEVDFD